MAPSAPLPGQHPTKGSQKTRNHSNNKPYARPFPIQNGESFSARSRKASTSTFASAGRAAPPSEGLLSGLKSMLSAPLGWMGLSSRASTDSERRKTAEGARMNKLPPPPPTPSARHLPSSRMDDLESGQSSSSSRYLLSPPQGPSAFSSSAAQRYTPLSTSHSMPYLDAPVNGLPFAPPPRSSRPLPSSSTTKHLPTSSLSSLPRSTSILFPTNGSVEAQQPMQRSERWMERYTRREDQSPAPESERSRLVSPGLARSTTSHHLFSVPPHLRPLPRSSSVVSLDTSRRSMSVEGEPDRKRSKSRGQMVWQPEDGFLSKSTVEQRAVPSPLPTSNAAERILLALESMRSPLLDARRHHPTLAFSTLPRSSSLSKIHVPSAASREKEKEDKKRDQMISPYGRGREKKEKERSEVKGSGLRNTLRRDEMEMDEDEVVDRSPVKTKSLKTKGKGKERERVTRSMRSSRRVSQMDEDEDETPKRLHTSKRAHDRDDDARMSESQGEPSSAPSSPPKRSIPTPATDDSAFQPLAPVNSSDSTSRARSALRARSSNTRKHISAVNSRSGTPGPFGRMSARDEDLPAEEDDDLSALDKIKFVMPGAGEATKSTLNGGGSLLSRMDPSAPSSSSTLAAPSSFGAPTSSSSSAALPLRVPSPNPFAAPPPPSAPAAIASRVPSASFSFATSAPAPSIIAPVPSTSGAIPNFFGSKAEVATPAAAAPKKSFSLGLGLPTNGSTTPSGPPPVKSSVPNFFENASVAASSSVPTPPSGGSTFLFGKPSTTLTAAFAPAPVASNPFAGVGVSKDAAPAAPAASSSTLAVEAPKATPSPFGGFGLFGSSSSTEAPKSIQALLSTATTDPPATAPSPVPTAPASNPFSFGQAAKPATASPSFGFGATAASSTSSFSFGGGEKKEASPAPVAPAPAASPSPFSFSAPASKESTPAPAPSSSSLVVPASNPFGSSSATAPASTGFSFGNPAASTPAPAATSSPSPFGSTPAAPSADANLNGAKDDSSMMESSPDRPTTFAFGSAAPTATSAPPTLFGGASSSLSAPKPAAPVFGGGGMFGSSAPSSSPFGAPTASTSPASFTFGQPIAAAPASGSFGASPSFGQAATPAPSFGQAATSAPSFGASSGFSFGGAAASPAATSSTFSFGAPSAAAPTAASPGSFNFTSPPQPQRGFGGLPSPALAPPVSNPFGSSAPAFGAAAPASTFSFGGGAPAPGASTFTFGGGSTSGSVAGTPPPNFGGSPGPQSPVAGTGTLFSMGSADSAPSPGRVAANGRAIRPLGSRRGAKRT